MKLKRKLFCFLLSFALFFNSSAQAVEEGDEVITPYYGPSFFKGVFGNPYSSSIISSSQNYKVDDIGTFGIYSEYLLNDIVGVGIDIYYNKSVSSWNETNDVYNPTTMQYEPKTYDYKVTAPTFAALGRFNFHYSSFYSLFSDDFDTYVILAFGYKKTNYKVQTNDPNYNFDPNKNTFSLFNASNPIGGKLGAGFRFFITDEAGITLELYAGRPYVSGGVSFRF